MQRDDPFVELSHISSSQQEEMTRCCFVGEPEDESLSNDEPGGIPVASTGIVMLSLPDSHEEQGIDVNVSRDIDVFLTPPEETFLAVSQEQQQQQQKSVSTDIREDRTVEVVGGNGNFEAVDGGFMVDAISIDLGRDADLGFPAEVEVTETIEIDSGSQSSPCTDQPNDNKVIYSESINFGETPLKKLKIVENNLGWHTPVLNSGSEAAQTIERVTRSIEKLLISSKNSEKLNENVVLESSKNISGAKTSSFLHTDNKLSLEGASPNNCSNSLHNHQNENVNGADKEFHGDGSAKRKLEFLYEALESRVEENKAILSVDEGSVEGETEEIEKESEVEDNEAVSAVNVDMIVVKNKTEEIDDDETERLLTTNETSPGGNSHESQKNRVSKSINDIDKFRYVRQTGENAPRKQKDFGAKRALPVSLLGNNSNVQGDSVPNGVASTSTNKKMTVFDVLRELAKKYTLDPSLAKMTALEAAKKGGMTFP